MNEYDAIPDEAFTLTSVAKEAYRNGLEVAARICEARAAAIDAVVLGEYDMEGAQSLSDAMVEALACANAIRELLIEA